MSWFIDGLFDDDVSVEIRDGSPDGETVCEILPFLECWTAKEIARAHLISAAPDLLIACSVVTAYLDKLESDSAERGDARLLAIRRRYHQPLRDVLNPAIAQAENRIVAVDDSAAIVSAEVSIRAC